MEGLGRNRVVECMISAVGEWVMCLRECALFGWVYTVWMYIVRLDVRCFGGCILFGYMHMFPWRYTVRFDV
jgi:hypothetical protein